MCRCINDTESRPLFWFYEGILPDKEPVVEHKANAYHQPDRKQLPKAQVSSN